jgi:DNA (cytosine-5)-methyltransferase 1
MKLEERGRAKFRPLKDYDIDEVKALLVDKIKKEQEAAFNLNNDDELKTIDYNSNKLNIVSLFSGCGGLDLGVELAGLDSRITKEFTDHILNSRQEFFESRASSLFHTIYSVDMFKEANQTYMNNFPNNIIQNDKDIRKIKYFPNCDFVLGGFPCPGFSEAGPRLIDDERNFLYIHFIRCLMQTKPFFFIAENVKGMMTLGKGEVLNQIIQDFESAGYKVKFQLVNARDYGIPQHRERVFIVGVREDIANDLKFEYQFPKETHGDKEGLKPYVTIRDSIGDLEADPGEYFEGGFSSIFLSRNRKKSWNDQSFTIQASGRQAPLHPSGPPMVKIGTDQWDLPGDFTQHRRMSVKEIARIQTFPDWYQFSSGENLSISKNGRLNKIYKQIGNAVPVELARVIARPIADWSSNNMDLLKEKRIETNQLELFEEIQI